MSSSQAEVTDPACPPSLAVYNTRFLSLSNSPEQREQWKKKIANVRHLVKQCDVVCVLETHVEGVTAEMFFGCNIDGTCRHYDHDIAVFINEKLHEVHKPRFEIIIPSVMVALSWHD